MTEIQHLSEVLSHANCPRCNSNDKEAIANIGDNYNLRCKHCWYEWTESWSPSMAKKVDRRLSNFETLILLLTANDNIFGHTLVLSTCKHERLYLVQIVPGTRSVSAVSPVICANKYLMNGSNEGRLGVPVDARCQRQKHRKLRYLWTYIYGLVKLADNTKTTK
jgi:hypothetical protein